MKNKGVTITIIIALLALIVGIGIGWELKGNNQKDNPKEKKEEKKPTSKDPIDIETKEPKGAGGIISIKYLGDKFFALEKDCGIDCVTGDYVIYDATGEMIAKDLGYNSFAITNDDRLYICDTKKIKEYTSKDNQKELNMLDECVSLNQKEDSDLIIASGIKDNKITFYNFKTGTSKSIDPKIDDMNFDMAILEPYHYAEDYDAYLGVGIESDDGNCKEYFYSAKDDSIKEFETDCWGKLK